VRKTIIFAVVMAWFSADTAFGLSGAGVAANANKSIGLVSSNIGASDTGTGTATLIDNGDRDSNKNPLDTNLLLTAAHIDVSLPFSQFTLTTVNNTPVEVLPVAIPTYVASTKTVPSVDDIGVMFLASPITGSGAPIPIATADPKLTAGTSTVNAVGYSSLAGQQVTFTVSALDAKTYTYTTVAGGGTNTAWFDTGDSGGPSLYQNADNSIVVVGEHSYLTTDVDTGKVDNSVDDRTDPYTSFLQGDGAGGKAVFSRYSASVPNALTAKWSDVKSWARGSTGVNTVPNDSDVVSLTSATANASLSVDVNTKNIYSMLNGIILNDTGGNTLNVGGLTFNGTLNAAMVNSGQINVNNNSTLTDAGSFDNAGTLSVGANGTMTAAAAQNVVTGTISVVGVAASGTQAAQPATVTFNNFYNQGNTTVGAQGMVNVTASSTFLYLTPSGDKYQSAMLNLGGTITVQAGGNMTVNTTATKIALNVRKGTIRVKGKVLFADTSDPPKTRSKMLNSGGAILSLDPATVTFENTDFDNDNTSALNGVGTVEFLQSGDFVNQADPVDSPYFDTRGIDFSYVGASSSFEVGSVSPFYGPYGASDPFAVNSLNLSADSDVTLTNDYQNQSTPDCLFLNGLSISDDSALDLDGNVLWEQGNDEGSLGDYITADQLVDSSIGPTDSLTAEWFAQYDATEVYAVPEPSGMLLMGAVLALLRRLRPQRA